MPPSLPQVIKQPTQLLIEIVSEKVVPTTAPTSVLALPETGSTTPALSNLPAVQPVTADTADTAATAIVTPSVTQEITVGTSPASGTATTQTSVTNAPSAPPSGITPSLTATSGTPVAPSSTSGTPAGGGQTVVAAIPTAPTAPAAQTNPVSRITSGQTTSSSATSPAVASPVAATPTVVTTPVAAVPSAIAPIATASTAATAESFSPTALASGSIDVAALSGTSPDFQNALSNALAQGASPAEAVQRASSAAAESAAAARTDTTPAATLASGSFATSSPLADSPAFQTTLSSLLAKGVSPAEAMQRAESANAASAAAERVDSSPAASLASGSFATSSPAAASPKFQAALGSLLARGVSPAEAVQRAESAAAADAAAASADNSPAASLASGSFATSSPASASPAFQSVLGNLLAKGISPTEAMRRAESAASDVAAGASSDARNLLAGLSSGDFTFLEKFSPTGDFSSTLGVTLARGVPIETAISRAMQADVVEQKAIKADAASNLAGFSSGNSAFPKGNSDFDRVVASAISRGESPANALIVARQVVAKMPAAVQTTSSALASGKNVDALLGTSGSSPTFEKALGNALSRGMSVQAATSYAKRVEAATALRLPLPPNLAKQVQSGGSVTATTVSGRPLPGWIRYDALSKGFVVIDAPSGTLPMEVAVTVNGKRTVLRISENSGGR